MNRSTVLIISFAFLLPTGCNWFGAQEPQEEIKATLGVEASLLTAAVWVAEHQGYFRDEGLDLTIKEFDAGRLSFLSMLNGEVDISTTAPTPIMFNSFRRQDFSIFATFVSSYDDMKVLARKDKGIATAVDLRGKRVGITAETTGQFFLASFLIHNGVDTSEVEKVDIAPSDLPHALKDSLVDAIVTWEPHAYNAMNLVKDKCIRLPSSRIYQETLNFMVMDAYANENPEVLKKILGAIDKATLFMSEHEEESQDIVSRRMRLDRKLIADLWNDFVFGLSLEQSLLITLEDEASWAIASKLTDKTRVPNYLGYVYMDAMEEIKPEAVTLIH